MAGQDPPLLKPVHWIGASREELRKFPDQVQREVGQALWFAQLGDKHPTAKPLKGFKSLRALATTASLGLNQPTLRVGINEYYVGTPISRTANVGYLSL